MSLLKTNYKNDVLDLSVNTDRKFQQVNNGDGSYSFVDLTTYQQVGDAFGMDDINTTNDAVNKISGGVAEIETGNTASRAYAVGEYLVYNGLLYKVTAAIASGNQLNVGGNIAATSVGSELTSLNNDSSNKLIVQTASLELGYEANQSRAAFINFNDIPSGYILLCPCGYIISDFGFEVDSFYKRADNSIRMDLKNTNNSAKNITVTAYGLMMRRM